MKLTRKQLKQIINEELDEMLSPDLKAKLDSLFATGDPADARSGLEFAEIYGIPITVQMISPFLMSNNIELVKEGIEMAFENEIELQHSDINPSYKIIKSLINRVKNPNAHPKILNIYATHQHTSVKMMVASHPNTSPETLTKLAMLDTSTNSTVVWVVANALSNPNIPVEIIKHYANSNSEEWRNISRNILKKRGIDIEPYQEPKQTTLDETFGPIYERKYKNMKLTTKQLKQIIQEELSGLVKEAETRMFSFLVQDSQKMQKDLNVLLPYRNPLRHPDLVEYRDYLFSSRHHLGPGEFKEPELSINDLIYQPDVLQGIANALKNLKDKINDPIFEKAKKLHKEIKQKSKEMFAQHRELFFDYEKDRNLKLSVRLMGLVEQGRRLDSEAEDIGVFLRAKELYDKVIDKNIQTINSVAAYADELYFGYDEEDQ